MLCLLKQGLSLRENHGRRKTDPHLLAAARRLSLRHPSYRILPLLRPEEDHAFSRFLIRISSRTRGPRAPVRAGRLPNDGGGSAGFLLLRPSLSRPALLLSAGRPAALERHQGSSRPPSG